MINEQWKKFFTICTETLGEGDRQLYCSQSWCAWTVFDRLGGDWLGGATGYWTGGLPALKDITDKYVWGGPWDWGDPFRYENLAHVIIPRRFSWIMTNPRSRNYAGADLSYFAKKYDPLDNKTESSAEQVEFREQDIDSVAAQLTNANISFHKTDLVLEIKLF
jgi:hypothetical protein